LELICSAALPPSVSGTTIPEMSRPPEIILAETAALTPAQQKFRRSKKGRLDFALPLDIWLDHRYSARPAERAKPVAINRGERWYTAMQVVKRAVDPRSKRRIVVVNGGSMSNTGRRLRP
jgi:hypothetical protein